MEKAMQTVTYFLSPLCSLFFLLLFPAVPALIAVSYSLCHSFILLSLFLWLALHLWLSNIILHLTSFSAPHHLNCYHYNQHPNCPRSPTYIRSLPDSPTASSSSGLTLLTCSPSCSFYQSLSPPCPHFLPHPLLHIAPLQREEKLISCHPMIRCHFSSLAMFFCIEAQN